MKFESRPLDGLDDGFLDEWRDLAHRALEPNPFFEPEFVLPARRHLGPPAGLRLLTVSDDGQLLALLPVWWGNQWRLPLTGANTWDHDYAFLGTPLVDRDRAREAFGPMLDGLGRSRPRARYLAMGRCASDGPVASVLGEVARARGSDVVCDRPYRRAVARRSEGPLIHVTGRHRRELARLRRRLECQVGGPVALTTRPGASGVDDFLRLEAAGWKGHEGTATAMAARDGHADFFRGICRGFADSGVLAFESLEANGTPVAQLCTLTRGTSVFWFKIAFDEEYREWSPGVHLMLDVSARFEALPPGWLMDSCAEAENQTINRLWTDRTTLATMVVPVGGTATRWLAGRIIHGVAAGHRRREGVS